MNVERNKILNLLIAFTKNIITLQNILSNKFFVKNSNSYKN